MPPPYGGGDIIMSRVYCMLCQHEEVSSLNAELIRRVKRVIYIKITVDELLSQSEYDLSVKTSIPGHSLHHLLLTYLVIT